MYLPHMGLACRELTFVRPERRTGSLVLDNLNADFDFGHATLITGPTGAGKSTLLHLLAGLLRPTSGEVWADGQPVSRWKPHHLDRWRRQVGVVFQHLHLMLERSALDNLVVRLLPCGDSPRKMRRVALAALEQYGLLELAEAPVRTLSGGQRQRVAVARALLGDPRFLLLDEPTTFQDDSDVAMLRQAFAEAAARGACVVVCAHDVRLRTGSYAAVWHMQKGHLESHP